MTNYSVVILDACRNNPYPGANRGDRGLARTEAIRGSLVAYATRPGGVAKDGEGRNSPYTEALLAEMVKPGVQLVELFNNVGWAVSRATNGAQEPWVSSSPLPKIYLAGADPGDAAPQAVQPRAESGASAIGSEPVRVQLAALLRSCELHYRANRLTTGVGGNALDCYEQVLQQAPTNEKALRGLEKIAERYVEWAEAATKRGDNGKAKVYLERLAKVSPEHPQLALLQERATPQSLSVQPPASERRSALEPETVQVRGGCFEMGSSQSEPDRDSDERQHEVCVEDFMSASTR